MGVIKNKPVLVGLSGGLDSLVAAYLLRIQKVDLYAVLLANTPEALQEQGDSFFACHQSEARIDAVKRICDHLQVPLTIVRARDEFEASVLESYLASRVELKKSLACLDCHQLRLRILYQKMVELKCSALATGHYAKLIRSTPDAPVSIHSSNDLKEDQSHLLISTPAMILDKLILPLSDLQKKEVLKIAENFKLHPPARSISFGQCFPNTPEMQNWTQSKIAPSLLGEGDVFYNEAPVAKHQGFHTLTFADDWKSTRPNEPVKKIAGCHWSENRVLLSDGNVFQDQGVFLADCAWGPEVDRMKPMRGFLHHGGGVNDLEVLVTPKTLGYAWVQLLEGQDEFIPGTQLAVFNRRGKNAKLLVSGVIHKLSHELPDNVVQIEVKGDKGPEMVKLDKDFNF
jgi:tRNA U34 2-thiouridine synthase MnmA/TrmU